MGNLADLDIGLAIRSMRDLEADFDRVPRMADEAVDRSEDLFDQMRLRAPTRMVDGDFAQVRQFANEAVDRSEAAFDGMNLRADTTRISGSFDEIPREAAAAADKAEDALSSAGPGFAAAAATVGLGAGVALAAALVGEFQDALADDLLGDVLAARLGETADRGGELGALVGDLWDNAFGDSKEQITDAIDAVVSSLGDFEIAPRLSFSDRQLLAGDTLADQLDVDAVRELTEHALNLASAFDEDVDESVNAAGILIRTGLADDATGAFDLIVAAMQQVPRLMRGELFPIIEEYSQSFEQLGIDGPEGLGLLVEAAQDGRFEIDKTGDALKELTIRGSDMSAASAEAYESIGLSAEKMSRRFLEGGDVARGALDDLVDGLNAIEDPVVRANTAIALFGTPLEDLGTDEVPQFLARLDDMGVALADVEGAAGRMGETLNDNVATDIAGFTRRASSIIDDWIQQNILPGAAEILDAFEEDGIGGAIDKAVELWEEAQPRVSEWWTGTFMPWWEETAVPWMAYIGGELGTALVNGLIDAVWELVSSSSGGLLGGLFPDSPLIGGALGELGKFDIDIPDLDNPIAQPGSGSGSGSGSGFPMPPALPVDGGGTGFAITDGGGKFVFHDGGANAQDGLGMLARKERVLSERQNTAFERFVDWVVDGGGLRPIEVYGDPSPVAMFRARELAHL